MIQWLRLDQVGSRSLDDDGVVSGGRGRSRGTDSRHRLAERLEDIVVERVVVDFQLDVGHLLQVGQRLRLEFFEYLMYQRYR